VNSYKQPDTYSLDSWQLIICYWNNGCVEHVDLEIFPIDINLNKFGFSRDAAFGAGWDRCAGMPISETSK
jgi:hypothetical protein